MAQNVLVPYISTEEFCGKYGNLESFLGSYIYKIWSKLSSNFIRKDIVRVDMDIVYSFVDKDFRNCFPFVTLII